MFIRFYRLTVFGEARRGITARRRRLLNQGRAIRGIDERDADGWLTEGAKEEIFDTLRRRFKLTEAQAEKFWWVWNTRAKEE